MSAETRQWWSEFRCRPREHHGPGVQGGTRHQSYLTSAEHGNPVQVRRSWPAVGRPTARKAEPGTGQDGQEANGGSRKAAGKRGQVTGPSNYGRARITGRIPGRGV